MVPEILVVLVVQMVWCKIKNIKSTNTHPEKLHHRHISCRCFHQQPSVTPHWPSRRPSLSLSLYLSLTLSLSVSLSVSLLLSRARSLARLAQKEYIERPAVERSTGLESSASSSSATSVVQQHRPSRRWSKSPLKSRVRGWGEQFVRGPGSESSKML